jgi:hypothetical protein
VDEVIPASPDDPINRSLERRPSARRGLMTNRGGEEKEVPRIQAIQPPQFDGLSVFWDLLMFQVLGHKVTSILVDYDTSHINSRIGMNLGFSF